jgi:hypothetical protein
MLVKQKGTVVLLHRIAGSAFMLLAAFVAFVSVLRFAVSFLQHQIEGNVLLVMLFGMVLYVSIFSSFGAYWLGRFPDILITATGLELKVFPGSYKIMWNEVAGIEDTSGIIKHRAVLVNRRGMLLNRLYGLAVRWNTPVILVSSRAENLEALERVIREHRVGAT